MFGVQAWTVTDADAACVSGTGEGNLHTGFTSVFTKCLYCACAECFYLKTKIIQDNPAASQGLFLPLCAPLGPS